MLSFEGDTGPYVQYTHARACSLLRKGNFKVSEDGFVMEDIEAWSVILQLMGFLEAINRAFEGYDPSQIATYVMDLSKAFNKYYATVRILEDIESKQARLTLVHCVKTVLKEGLRLLRLEAPEEM